MTPDAAIVLAGLLAVAALCGVVWSCIRLANALMRIENLETKLLAPSERPPHIEVVPSRRDEYAPDATMDHMEDVEWVHNFQPPDSWRR